MIEIQDDLLVKLSRAATRSFRILPMRSTSFTRPVAMKVAQTFTAAEARSGDESALNAGVRAELICAWYCSSKRASEKSGSGMVPKICKPLAFCLGVFQDASLYRQNLIDQSKTRNTELNHRRCGCKKCHSDHIGNLLLQRMACR